jgi:hypothetical protein
MTEKSLGPKNLMLVLGAVVVLTSAVLMILAVIPKTTLIELSVRAQRVSFTAMPTLSGESLEPLHNRLKIHGMEIQGSDFFTARLDHTADRQFDLQPHTTIYLKCQRPSKPVLKLFGGATVDLRAYKREHIVAMLELSGDEPKPMWQSWIQGPCEMKMNQPAVSAVDGRTDLPVEEWVQLDKDSRLRLSGGKRESTFRMHLSGVYDSAVSQLKVIDLQTGRTTVTQDLDLHLPQSPTIIPHQDRLIVLEKNPAAKHRVQLLKTNLDVVAPRFFKLTGQQEESFVRGGTIRFPAKERQPVSIEPDAFIKVDGSTRLKLKSMALVGGQLELVLWGRPASLKIGPSAGLLNQHLPSLLLWAYTHRSGTLMFSILGWILGSTIAALKLFGLITK